MFDEAGHRWLKFVYYMDVFGWLFKAIAQNEFLAPRFQFIPAGGTVTLGDSYLAMLGTNFLFLSFFLSFFFSHTL
jgi:hypothetical protein